MVIEIMDVIHCCETALHMLEDSGINLDGIKESVVKKNEKRGYYSMDA